MDSLNVIALINHAIDNNNLESLKENLDRLSLNALSQHDFEILLSSFLQHCASHSRNKAAHLVMETFENTGILDDSIPLFTSLFMSYNFTEFVLSFMIGAFPEMTFYDQMVNLISYDEAPELSLAAGRLAELYSPKSLEDYQDLYEVAYEKNNVTMQIFCEDKLKELAPVVPKPSWVKNFTGRAEIPYDDELVLPDIPPVTFELPPLETMADLLLEGLKEQGASVDKYDEARQVLLMELSKMTAVEKIAILTPFKIAQNRLKLDQNLDLSRILGPVNATVDSDLASDHICCRYGGCRMFTCIEFEKIDPEDDSVDETVTWFTGNCQYCLNKLPNPYWAVRKPLPNGGWKGCYCSPQCIRWEEGEVMCDTEQCQLQDKNSPNPNALVLALINELEKSLTSFGIQERRLR